MQEHNTKNATEHAEASPKNPTKLAERRQEAHTAEVK
jgi:hypothetical protein